MILIYILEFFPGKKFTFWNFSQGKSLHFGIFPREKVYILEFSQGKIILIYILEFSQGKIILIYILEFFPRF